MTMKKSTTARVSKSVGVPASKAKRSVSGSRSSLRSGTPPTTSRASAPFRQGDIVRWKNAYIQHKYPVAIRRVWKSEQFGSGYGVDVVNANTGKPAAWMSGWCSGHFLLVCRPLPTRDSDVSVCNGGGSRCRIR